MAKPFNRIAIYALISWIIFLGACVGGWFYFANRYTEAKIAQNKELVELERQVMEKLLNE